MIAADVKAPLLPSQEAALLLPQAGRSSAAKRVISISRAEPVPYLLRAAIICLNPSLRAAAVLSLDSGVSLSPRPTAATRGFGTKSRLFSGGNCGLEVRFSGGGGWVGSVVGSAALVPFSLCSAELRSAPVRCAL